MADSVRLQDFFFKLTFTGNRTERENDVLPYVFIRITTVLISPKGFDIMECRVGCGACCIAPSINSPIPGMPGGKPPGIRCIQLTDDNKCRLFGMPERPSFCVSLKPSAEMCGLSSKNAYEYLIALEAATKPEGK